MAAGHQWDTDATGVCRTSKIAPSFGAFRIDVTKDDAGRHRRHHHQRYFRPPAIHLIPEVTSTYCISFPERPQICIDGFVP
jgi:hypothetical protein